MSSLEEDREFWRQCREAVAHELSEGTNDKREPGDWIPYGRAPLELIPEAEPIPYTPLGFAHLWTQPDLYGGWVERRRHDASLWRSASRENT